MALDPGTIASTLLAGLVLGSLYALMAMGLSMIYSTVRVLNFAHGAFYITAPYIVWYLTTPAAAIAVFGGTAPTSPVTLPFWLASIIAIAAVSAMGVATERVLIRPLIRKSNASMTTLVASFALAVIVVGILTIIFGGARQQFTQDIAPGHFRVADITITATDLVQLGVAITILVGTQLYLKRTRLGIGMRAVAQDMEASNLVGINPNTVYRLAFGLGSAFAGVSGILLANIFFLSPSGGWDPLTYAFIIVIFGGIGSVGGTILASFILAIVQQFVTLPLDTTWGLVFAFVLMMIVLVVRPRGLFGFKEN